MRYHEAPGRGASAVAKPLLGRHRLHRQDRIRSPERTIVGVRPASLVGRARYAARLRPRTLQTRITCLLFRLEM